MQRLNPFACPRILYASSVSKAWAEKEKKMKHSHKNERTNERIYKLWNVSLVNMIFFTFDYTYYIYISCSPLRSFTFQFLVLVWHSGAAMSVAHFNSVNVRNSFIFSHFRSKISIVVTFAICNIDASVILCAKSKLFTRFISRDCEPPFAIILLPIDGNSVTVEHWFCYLYRIG